MIPGLAWDVPIASGTWLQLYLGSMRGEGEVRLMLTWAKRLGLPGVVFHGGREGLTRGAAMARSEGVAFAFSFGLDGGGKAKDKGRKVGELLAGTPGLLFALLDAEGQWDVDKGPEDETDEQGALELGEELRKLAPEVILGDQPWFAIQSHGDERKTAKPLGEGGTFAGFPSDEFASFVDCRIRQLYFRNLKGKDAYGRCRRWSDRDWAQHDASLRRLNLERPHSWTLQGYGHAQRPQDFVDALLTVRDRANVLWFDAEFRGESWAVTASCLAAVRRIIDGGHAPEGREPVECVKSWQRELGLVGPQVDGLCGWGTLGAAGFERP